MSDGTPIIIDFMNVCRGPALYDIARTYFLIKQFDGLLAKKYLKCIDVSENDIAEYLRFLYKGIIINHNKKLSQPTLKRRFFKNKAAFFSWPGLGKEWC